MNWLRRIDTYVKNHNRRASPFQWTATADSILGKIARLLKAFSGTQHERTPAKCEASSWSTRCRAFPGLCRTLWQLRDAATAPARTAAPFYQA